MKKLIIIVIFGLINLPIYTQAPDWNTVGNFVNSTDFLGTTNNQNLTLTRNNLPRATFGNLNPWVGLNGDTDLNASRITLGLNGEINPAWSMLHLWEGNLTAAMYRNWFNVGTSYTGNGDFMYTGLMHRPVAEATGYASDAIIAWGCQDSATTNVDNFRILFLDRIIGTPALEASQTNQGLEVLRISPIGNVGIGDFSSMTWGLNSEFEGLNEQPTQKLDVDGTARLRQMPDSLPDVIITGVRPDTLDSLGNDFILNYIELDSLFGLSVCTWDTIGDDVYMGTPDNCQVGNAAIGQEPVENTRFSIFEEVDDSLYFEFGQQIHVSGFQPGYTNYKTGLYSEVSDNVIKDKVAVDGYALDGGNNYGIRGQAYDGDNNYGVYGEVDSDGSSYAIYGKAPPTPNDWAGYFEGKAYCTSMSWGSDEMLKQNIEDIENAVETLQQIECKTYNFRTEEYPQLNFSEGQHLGVIAQNLEEVLPNLITEVVSPEQFDEEGNLEHQSVSFKSVNYIELIPILIQATKEQQAEMDVKNDRIDDLEAQIQSLADMVAHCCADQAKSNQNNQGANDIQIDKNLLKQNTPNPFDLNTSIEYYLAQAGKVTIKVTNAQGQLIDVLVSEDQDQGSHKIQWTAKNITRGVYYYSLTINGEEMVKRMVKL